MKYEKARLIPLNGELWLAEGITCGPGTGGDCAGGLSATTGICITHGVYAYAGKCDGNGSIPGTSCSGTGNSPPNGCKGGSNP